MSMNPFQSIRDALASLNPHEMREHAERPLRLFLYGADDYEFQRMQNFFAPPALSVAKRAELESVLHRASESLSASAPHDLEIYYEEPGNRSPSKSKNAFAFDPSNPDRTINEVLKNRPDLAIPLARHIYPFRQPVAQRIVKKISKENALFALATAVPDIIPLISLPWAITEFASDTAFLTANQIRMLFFLAAASDRVVGYKEQRGEIGTIVLGAFGWRAIARELVGKIPLGGGLIPKAAIAYAGTRVVGLSLERYFRLGYGYSRQERREAYQQAFERGKTIAGSLVNAVRRPS
jgi:hypothetical protein